MPIFYWLAKISCLGVGVLYSFKALRQPAAGVGRTSVGKRVAEWVVFWIVLAAYLVAEPAADALLFWWMPMYNEIKTLIMLYFITFRTTGAKIIYRSFVRPQLSATHRLVNSAWLRIPDTSSWCATLWQVVAAVVGLPSVLDGDADAYQEQNFIRSAGVHAGRESRAVGLNAGRLAREFDGVMEFQVRNKTDIQSVESGAAFSSAERNWVHVTAPTSLSRPPDVVNRGNPAKPSRPPGAARTRRWSSRTPLATRQEGGFASAVRGLEEAPPGPENTSKPLAAAQAQMSKPQRAVDADDDVAGRSASFAELAPLPSTVPRRVRSRRAARHPPTVELDSGDERIVKWISETATTAPNQRADFERPAVTHPGRRRYSRPAGMARKGTDSGRAARKVGEEQRGGGWMNLLWV